jgi:hypothetical protein
VPKRMTNAQMEAASKRKSDAQNNQARQDGGGKDFLVIGGDTDVLPAIRHEIRDASGHIVNRKAPTGSSKVETVMTPNVPGTPWKRGKR